MPSTAAQLFEAMKGSRLQGADPGQRPVLAEDARLELELVRVLGASIEDVAT
jgi:hypothetical protein